MSGIQIADAVVRVQALDGQWETVGVDLLAGIVPENISCSSNEWGSEKASFDLRRDPGGIYPDLTAFTPVDIEVAGTKVWSGRVSSTPSRDGSDSVMNVQCEGWQYHLDDDVYERRYVVGNMTGFEDMRTFPAMDLTACAGAGATQNDGNGVYLNFPPGIAATNGKAVGMMLNLGPFTKAARIVATWNGWGTDISTILYCRVTDNPGTLFTVGSYSDAFSATLVAGPTTSAGTPATAGQYVCFFLYRNGVTATPGEPGLWAKITDVKIFASTAYESGNASILKASDVVSDALGRATIFLTDTTGVTASSFSIPEYAPDAPRTPREHINAVNAYHAWRAQVTVDRRLLFQAQPTSPLFEAGEWSGCEITDASMNDGDEIYSRVIVEATGPDGVLMRTARSQAQQTGVGLQAIASPVPDNPSFAVNTTSWTPTGATITRDTVTFDSTPASGRWDNTGASDVLGVGDALTTTFTGTFLAGVTYTLALAIRNTNALPTTQAALRASFGHAASGDQSVEYIPDSVGAFTTRFISWQPTANRASGVTLTLTAANIASLGYCWIDSLALFTATPTVVDRRGFRRTKILPVSSALTTAAAQQIADTYLSLHRYTTYRGSLQVTGQGGVRTHQGGQGIHPADLLLYTQEKVRLTNRINPDDGSVGRDGTIASVSYDHNTNTASVELDNRTTNFESFLERLALLTGQVR